MAVYEIFFFIFQVNLRNQEIVGPDICRFYNVTKKCTVMWVMI